MQYVISAGFHMRFIPSFIGILLRMVAILDLCKLWVVTHDWFLFQWISGRPKYLLRITDPVFMWFHYDDVIMSTIASQITSLTIVYSIVYSDAYQSKHQSSASLALWGEFTGDWWIPCTYGQLRGKCFHLITLLCRFNRYWHFNGSKLSMPTEGCHPESGDVAVLGILGFFGTFNLLFRKKNCSHSQVSTNMMTSSNGSIFRVTGHLCWKFTGPRWIPRTKAIHAEL